MIGAMTERPAASSVGSTRTEVSIANRQVRVGPLLQ
jgi:hypothetical protein